jgi:hypothetical protein
VDFVLYGQRGLVAVEVKRSGRVGREDLAGLLKFRENYPRARLVLLHGGTRRWHESGVDVMPVGEALADFDHTVGLR